MGQSILWIQLLTKYIQGKLESIWTTSYFLFFHINIQTFFEPEFVRISPESSVELGLGEIGGKIYFWRQIRKIKIQMGLEIKERGNNGYIKIAVTLFVLSVLVSMTGYIFFYHTFGIIINYKLTQKELMSTTDIYYPHRQFYLDHQSNIYASYQQIYPAPHQSILPHVDSNTLLMANSGKSAGSNNKVKTSLCKKWAEFGTCPYLHKCQFAHGIQQLRCNVDENSYKTKHCNAFFKKGYCPYGFRCNFSHKQAQGAEDETRKIQKQTILGYREILKVAAKQEGKSRLYQSFAQKLDESDSKSISSTEDCRSESLSKSRLGYMEEKIDDSGLNFTEFSVSLLFQPALASASTAEGEEDNTIDANKGLLYFNIDQFC